MLKPAEEYMIDITSPFFQCLKSDDLKTRYVAGIKKVAKEWKLTRAAGDPPRFQVSTQGTRGTAGDTNKAKDYIGKTCFSFFA